MLILRFSLPVVFSAAVLALGTQATLCAATIFTTVLSGVNEVPGNGSVGFGTSMVTLSGNQLTVNEAFSGLSVAAGAAHIHCCAPVGIAIGVAVPFTGFPAGTSGTYSNTFDLTMLATYTAAFVSANGGTAASAEAALIAGLNAGQTYANIHNANFPGGEIRGQLLVTPEPGTAGFLLLGLVPLIAKARKTRSQTV